MRRLFLFVAPILIIVCAVFVVFGILHIRREREKALDDLYRRSKNLAEGMELSAQYVLKNKDQVSADYLTGKFDKRERLQGCIIYDKAGDIFSVTKKFSDWKVPDAAHIEKVLSGGTPDGALYDFNGRMLYSYVLPVLGDSGEPLGVLEIINDTSYIFVRLGDMWRSISVTLLVLVIVIILVSFPIQRMLFVAPIKQLTEWFENFQRGDIDGNHPIKDKDELGRLASEVEQVALSLRVARRTISEEAKGHLAHGEIWTEGKLRTLV